MNTTNAIPISGKVKLDLLGIGCSMMKMSNKAPYRPDDPTRKQTFTIQTSLLDRAKNRAKIKNGGNLSLYIQTLIERDLDGDESPRVADNSRIIEQLAKVIWRSDIADSLKGKIPTHIDQQGLLGAFIAAVPRYIAAEERISQGQRISLGIDDLDNWRAPDICIVPTKVAAPICQVILMEARRRANTASTQGQKLNERLHLAESKGQVAYLESDMAQLLVRNTPELFNGISPSTKETACQAVTRSIEESLRPKTEDTEA